MTPPGSLEQFTTKVFGLYPEFPLGNSLYDIAKYVLLQVQRDCMSTVSSSGELVITGSTLKEAIRIYKYILVVN